MTVLDQMMRSVLESLQEGVLIIDSSRNIVYINPEAVRILRLSDEGIIGKDVVKTVPNTRLHIVLQTARPEYDKLQYLGDTVIVTSRMPLFDMAGNILGVAAIFRDITSVQKMAEEVTNLKEIEAQLKAIIDSTHDAISVADEKGRITLVNEEYTRITGLTSEEVVGKPATIDIIDIEEGESYHLMVSKTRQPVLGKRLVVGKTRREVIVDVMPLVVGQSFRGSVGVIHDVTEISSLMHQLVLTRSSLKKTGVRFSFSDIIAASTKMKIALEQAQQVSSTMATVLLRGESGTGKELFAHAIHHSSPRGEGPFIEINCASLDSSLLQYEIFGTVESKPATSEKPIYTGLLKKAQGGTLFLDEISNLDRSTQVKLLGFLQTREYARIGSKTYEKPDVRLIVSTNSHLEAMIEEGTFLRDLYFRLNVVPILIPPLRERMEDLESLVEIIIARFNLEYGKRVRMVTSEVIGLFRQYDWPGNVRELENAVGRAMIKASASDEVLGIDNFDFLIISAHRKESNTFQSSYKGKLNEILGGIERQAIVQYLYKNEGNRERTAKELGISLRSLYYKIKNYRIDHA